MVNSRVTKTLRSGELMASNNGCFVAIMHFDGNLATYELAPDGAIKRLVWATGTNGNRKTAYAALHDDGNLAVYGPNNDVLWNTTSMGQKGLYALTLQDDGNLVVYNQQDQEPLWSNYTGCIV